MIITSGTLVIIGDSFVESVPIILGHESFEYSGRYWRRMLWDWNENGRTRQKRRPRFLVIWNMLSKQCQTTNITIIQVIFLNISSLECVIEYFKPIEQFIVKTYSLFLDWFYQYGWAVFNSPNSILHPSYSWFRFSSLSTRYPLREENRRKLIINCVIRYCEVTSE